MVVQPVFSGVPCYSLPSGWVTPISGSIHSLTLSFDLNKPDEGTKFPYHYGVYVFMSVERFFGGALSCCILAQTSELVYAGS